MNWNTQEIIKNLNKTPSINKIYFTRSKSGCWTTQINHINKAFPNINIVCIYTPSGQGGALHDQTGIVGQGKMIPLLKHRVHNNQRNYGKLNNIWLTKYGVNINNF